MERRARRGFESLSRSVGALWWRRVRIGTIAKVVFTSREHVIALEARGKGLLGVTLRYPYEVRAEAEFFDDIPDEEIPKDMLDLASHIVATKAEHFDPKKFEDRYEAALEDLIKKKQSGKPIERPERREPAKVINLMDALRRSVEAGKPSSRREARAAALPRRAPAKRSHGRRKAG
jgi:DNA end-binding protein Ku